ncbi:MAG TPA: zf-HC2 domain-containing protein [Longimicrobiales bacterium]
MNYTNSHPEAERLEALAAGELNAGDAAVVESHLVGCARCREEVEEWRALFGALGDLPGLEPDPGFADAVMARVVVRSVWAERLSALARWLTPRTTQAWALVAAVLALPALVYAGAFAWLATQPWFSIAGLSVFVRQTVPGWLDAAGTELLGTIIFYGPLQNALAQLSAIGTGELALFAAAFGTALVVSGWVLYTNLFHTPKRESGYATFAF